MSARAIVRGTSRVLAGSIVARALDFTWFLLLARTLGVERFGLVAFAVVVKSAVTLATGAALLAAGAGVRGAAFAFVLGSIAQLGISIVQARDLLPRASGQAGAPDDGAARAPARLQRLRTLLRAAVP